MNEEDQRTVFAPALGLGLLAAAGVVAGQLLGVPGMNLRDGFHGAGFLGSFLYAAQPPVWLGLLVVGGLYFAYGLLTGLVLGLLLRAAGRVF